MQNGAEDVKRHRWFKSMDWNDVILKKLKVSNSFKDRDIQFCTAFSEENELIEMELIDNYYYELLKVDVMST